MHHQEDQADTMPTLMKGLLLLVVGLFVVIGLVGLILPIIPGILFLALAALLLSRVSRRFAFHLDNHAGWNRLRRRWREINFLSIGQRARLLLLMTARSLVGLVESGLDFLRRKL